MVIYKKPLKCLFSGEIFLISLVNVEISTVDCKYFHMTSMKLADNMSDNSKR